MTASSLPTPRKAPRSPAYVATVTARNTRTSARPGIDLTALDGRRIPVAIDGAGEHLPIAQVELAIQDEVRALLGREVCAVLWRDRDGGDLFVMHGGRFVPVASLTLTPARAEVAAA